MVAEPTTTSRNRWRGMSADARTAERREALVEVAYELVGTEGMAGTTVRRVCEEARLNPRYFYESFPDLDALVVAVFDRVAEEAFEVMTAAIAQAVAAGESVEEMARVSASAFIRHVVADPRRARVLFIEGFTNAALGLKRFATLHDLVEAMLADARADAVARTGSDKLPSMVLVASNHFIGGMAELLVSWCAGKLPVTVDELVEDSVALFINTAKFLEQRQLADAAEETAGADEPDLARQS